MADAEYGGKCFSEFRIPKAFLILHKIKFYPKRFQTMHFFVSISEKSKKVSENFGYTCSIQVAKKSKFDIFLITETKQYIANIWK